MTDTSPSLHIPGVLKALEQRSLPHRLILVRSEEDQELTRWTQKAFPWGFSQIEWGQVSHHNCIDWTSLDDLVPAFEKVTETLNTESLVVVMWNDGLCPVIEMLLRDVRKIARNIFEEHETSTDVLVFSRSEGWLIEMHHEGTLCVGTPNSPLTQSS